MMALTDDQWDYLVRATNSSHYDEALMLKGPDRRHTTATRAAVDALAALPGVTLTVDVPMECGHGRSSLSVLGHCRACDYAAIARGAS